MHPTARLVVELLRTTATMVKLQCGLVSMIIDNAPPPISRRSDFPATSG